MARMAIAIFTMALLPPLPACAQSVADFSGTWKMDPTRSESAHQAVPIGPVTLVIKQTATDISIETRKADTDKREIHSETLTYKLDGSESTVAGSSLPPSFASSVLAAALAWSGSR